MRVVFLGTPEFAVPALEAMLASPIGIAAVFTQPDRPSGRGRRLTPPPVKARALEAGLEVRQPGRIRSGDIAPFAPDAVAVAAYGQILSRKFLAVPRLGAFNLHPSLLPRWRGAAPIQRALLAGDRETGACVIRLVHELDAGPVLARLSLPIGPRDTAEDLHGRLAAAGGPLLVEALLRLERGEAEEEPQPEGGVTYAAKLAKEEAPLDWSLAAGELDRRVRGLRPWPVAETAWPGLAEGAVRIWKAYPLPPEGPPEALPGEALGLAGTPEGRGLRVRTGGGDLAILELQPPGGRRMEAEAFLRGRPLPAGARLGARG
ncbi:MAG: methionyl-tRNA formyltransferase [Candidatus Tectomicrobia bacterium]|nr:methionyl-tRNA formyltransferase [Candidatus Tectomicrobia bacterium]